MRRIYEDVNIAYKRETSIDRVYMIYGVQVDDPDILRDLYVYVILVKMARALLSGYPDVDKYDGACR